MTPKHNVITAFARGLMKQPELLAVSCTPRRLTMTTTKGDYSRLVGKGGAHIRAMERLGDEYDITVILADAVENVAPIAATLKEPEDVLADAVRILRPTAKIDSKKNKERGVLEVTVDARPALSDTARAAIDTLTHSIARTALLRMEVEWR